MIVTPDFLAQGAEGVVDQRSGGGVDFAGRLVGKQQRRMIRQPDGNCYALLFAARKLGEAMMHAAAKPDQPQQFGGALAAAARLAGDGHWQHHVFDGVEIGDQVARALLPDKANALTAIAVELAIRHAQQILPIHQYSPSRRSIQPAEDIHQRRLAAAAGADNRHQFPALDAQVQLAQRHLLQPGDFIDFDQPVTQNKWFCQFPTCCIQEWRLEIARSRFPNLQSPVSNSWFVHL